MTNDALREREAVVAWLRRMEARHEKSPSEEKALTIRLAANAIERGDHLKDTQP